MKKQNNKMRKMAYGLLVAGLGLSVATVANSTSKTFSEQRKVETDERLQVAKPVAGRNRRRSRLPVILPRYPRANADKVRASPQTNKLRINVLSNDNGYKLRVVDINSRSAGGARVSVRNDMAVYQIPRHFVGKDSFWYTMEDKSGRQHSAKVIVCVCDK